MTSNISNNDLFHTTAPIPVMQSNTFFQNARDFRIGGNPTFQSQNNITNVYTGGTDILERLERFVSFDAQIDSSAQDTERVCHPGTRMNVLNRLGDWIDSRKTKEHIVWLYGPAGAGKSAIAQTFANLHDRPKLFTTLAYQIALSMPEIKDYIADALSERPDLPTKNAELQFKQLIARPFQALSEDGTQQLSPAVDAIVDIVKRYQDLAPVIVIDGVDECFDENLQRQFLKVIGDAVTDDCFPLRFLIVSRPELHIEQSIRQFQAPTLTINLAELDDANRDIEKYLIDEFSRIASEQGLAPTWPGRTTINDLVYKSSGNFIFPSLVIRFVSDPDNIAQTQLNIVLKIKPPTTMAPFAVLDQLFLEILRRVPDQDFLKKFLALLVARFSASKYHYLDKDDAVLMHISEKELHAKLRRMRSLLKFVPSIDVYHKSFVDFLHDSSRSGPYYIREYDGISAYFMIFVDSFVRYVSSAIERPDHFYNPYFTTGFKTVVKRPAKKIVLPVNKWPAKKIVLPVDKCPDHFYNPYFTTGFKTVVKRPAKKIVLPVDKWQEMIKSLIDLQDKLFQLPNYTSAWDTLICDKRTIFRLLRELMHLCLHLGFDPVAASVGGAMCTRNLHKRTAVISPITTDHDNELDNTLLSLFAHLPEITETWRPTETVINLLTDILRFDYARTAGRIYSVSNAQKLIDLLDYMIHSENIFDSEARRKASFLAFKIFIRVPIVPLSYFLNGNFKQQYYSRTADVEVLSQTIFAYRLLDPCYISKVPLGAVESDDLLNPFGEIEVGLGRGALSQFYSSPMTQHSRLFQSSSTSTSLSPSLATDGGYVSRRPGGQESDHESRTQGLSLFKWHQTGRLCGIKKILLSLAETIEYLQSMGVILHQEFDARDILLNSRLEPTIRCLCACSVSPVLIDDQAVEFSPEGNVLSFGVLSYELYHRLPPSKERVDDRRVDLVKYGNVSNIPYEMWQLIQRCSAKESKSRPTIGEVILRVRPRKA